jgi:uncharacterized protein YydD (DUF2326 family)
MVGGEIGRGNSVLDAAALKDDTLFMSLDILNAPVTASRSPGTRGRIEVSGDTNSWPIRPDVNKKTGATTLTARNWNDLLGRTFFGLPPESQIPARSNLSNSACIGFFVRRARDGAFAHWVLTHRAQSSVRQAVPLFHLFGLDPDVALKFVRLDETRKAAAELKRAIDKGLLSKAVGSVAHLRNELVKARRRAQRIRSRIEGVDILEFYGEYEQEAARLDRQINEINDANYIDEQLLQDLQRATDDEAAPAIPDIRRLYEEAHVVLPEVSLRQYEEVKSFHETIVSNRRAHLNSEINSARKRVTARNRERERLVERHHTILGLLQSGVSLGHFRKLDSELIQAEAEIADVSHRLALAEKFEGLRLDARAEKVDAERSLRDELRERRALIDESIAVFQEISGAIYESPAEFDISATSTGPRFSIKEPAILSDGINNMQIFTFDMTLAVMSAKRGSWPGFLIHDSHVFDGVDGRQIGAALRVGNERSLALEGQYIVTMNSDDLEKAQRETGEDFSSFVLDPVLADREAGGLFGFSFEHDVSGAALAESEE